MCRPTLQLGPPSLSAADVDLDLPYTWPRSENQSTPPTLAANTSSLRRLPTCQLLRRRLENVGPPRRVNQLKKHPTAPIIGHFAPSQLSRRCIMTTTVAPDATPLSGAILDKCEVWVDHRNRMGALILLGLVDKAAGTISCKALEAVIAKAEAGATVLSLCQDGDRFIEEQCAAIYNKAKVPKGISFPTTVSVNKCAQRFDSRASCSAC